MVKEITVAELKKRLDAGDQPTLLDVREQQERDAANIGGKFIPIAELGLRYKELDPASEIVVYCHMGGRSRAAVVFLTQKGFQNVKNLTGGIDAWSVKVDPKVKRY